jgi:putative peptide zinc metalloprotease protein
LSSLARPRKLLAATRPEEGAKALAARHGPPDERPALRKDLGVLRQVQMGDVVMIIKNPETLKYFQFRPSQWAIMKLFDGTRTTLQILEEINRHNRDHPASLEFVLEYEEFLRERGLIEQTAAERSLKLLDKFKTLRAKRAEERSEGFNPFFIMFHVLDPNRILNRTAKYIRWIWTPPVAFATLAASVWVASVFARNWDVLWTGTYNLYHFFGKPLLDVLQFFVILSFVGAIHEFCHGYVCKIYGGEVHDIGFALFYFTPAFYCDTSDSYMFANKYQRLWVTLAGVYIEIIICSIATALWVASYPDTLLHQFAFKTMLFTGISAVFFNLNPLIKVDGYFALSSLLQMPDLREGAWRQVGAWFQKYLLRLPVQIPVTTRRKRRIYYFYGILSMCYTALVMAFVFRLFRNFYFKYFPDFGVVFLVLTLLYIFRKKARTLTRVSKLFYLDKKELFMHRRSRARLLWVGAGLLLLLAIPWTRRTIAAEAFLKPLEEANVQAPEDGTVTEVFVHEGDSVEKGQQLFRVSSPSVDAETERSLSQRDRFARKSSGNRSAANAAMMFQSESRASAAETAVETARYRQRFLLIRSPIRGRVLTPRTQDLEGRFVVVGYPLAQIGDCRKMAAEVPVSERLLEYLKVGAPVRAQVGTHSSKTYAGSVVRISPATLAQPATAAGKEPEAPTVQPDRFVALAVFDNGDGSLLPRAAVRVKIRSSHESYASRVWNILWRWARTVLW